MVPSRSLFLVHVLILISSLLSDVQSQFTCDESFSIEGTNNLTNCIHLSTLGFELGWRYGNTFTNITLNVVFSAKPPNSNGWVAWGVNPGQIPEMVGTQALIAFVHANGTPVVQTYILTIDTKNGCVLKSSPLDFEVVNKRVVYSAGTGLITVAATMILPMANYNAARLNHVWQMGPLVIAGDSPIMHGKRLENFDSRQTLNLNSGESKGLRHHNMRIVHGVLSIIGWGFLLPMGAIFTRYFKGFPFRLNRWHPIHVVIQTNAFLIGTIAWGIGLSMVGISEHYKVFIAHRIIGILIFIFASLQMMALWQSPINKKRNRRNWNIYHHFLGYALIGLAIINVFKGLAILRPPIRWRMAYIGVLSGLGGVIITLECAAWFKFCWGKICWPYIRNAMEKDTKKLPILDEKEGGTKP